MKVGLRQFSNQSIESFKQAVGSGEFTRSGLARKLCELTDWRNKKGDRCLAQARKALPELASQLSITLPTHRGKIPQVSTYDRYEAMPSLDCSLEQLGEISVKLVSKNETRSWHSMMHSWHPRDVPRLPGQALKYWVVSEHHRPLERFRAALFPAVPDEADWTELEYGGSTYPEARIAKRLLSMGKAWDKARGDETPRIFNTTASQKVVYRLFNNEQVTMDDFFESHRQSTVQRCAQHPVVLSVQDTTTLNFDSLKVVNKDLCSVGGTAKGICTHVNMAFSPDGSRVLGVLDIDGDFRPRIKADAKQGSDKDAKQVAKDQSAARASERRIRNARPARAQSAGFGQLPLRTGVATTPRLLPECRHQRAPRRTRPPQDPVRRRRCRLRQGILLL